MLKGVVKFLVTSVFKSAFGCAAPGNRYTYYPYMSVYCINWNLTIWIKYPGCGDKRASRALTGPQDVTYRLLTTRTESGQWRMEPEISTDRRHLWNQLSVHHFTVTRNPSLGTPDTLFVRTNDTELQTRIEDSLRELSLDYGYEWVAEPRDFTHITDKLERIRNFRSAKMRLLQSLSPFP